MQKKKQSYQSKYLNKKNDVWNKVFVFFRQMRLGLLGLLGKQIADEDSCTICFDHKADVMLYPCKHE